MKKIIIICIFLLTIVPTFGQSNFSRGEELLMQNKPSEAVIFLENAARDDGVNVKTWLYLGIVYEQLNKFD